jgi:HlyD family secretion protein
VRRKIAIAAAVLVLATAGFVARGSGLLEPGRDAELTLNGNVDIRQVNLGFRGSGRIQTIAFEEGARVGEGTALAALDTRPLEYQLAADEANVAYMSAVLEKLKNGNRPQDIAQAVARLEEAKATLVKAKADFDRRSELVRTGAVSRADFSAVNSQHNIARAQVHAAEEALSLLRAGAREEDIAAAEARLRQAAAQAERARRDLDDATLRAPAAGVILTRAREPGAIVQPGETVLTLTIDRPLRVRAYIDEADLSRISPGMKVVVTADGNPKSYHGNIGFVSPTAEFTPKTVETRELRTNLVYRIRVIVTDSDDALRQGQPVTVRIPDRAAPDLR